MPVGHMASMTMMEASTSGRAAIRSALFRCISGRRRAVELMADFTDWEAVRCTASGWRMAIERLIARGTHRVAIRIDGGQWIVPPNLPRVADEFGGEVGIVVVP